MMFPEPITLFLLPDQADALANFLETSGLRMMPFPAELQPTAKGEPVQHFITFAVGVEP